MRRKERILCYKVRVESTWKYTGEVDLGITDLLCQYTLKCEVPLCDHAVFSQRFLLGVIRQVSESFGHVLLVTSQ